MVYTYAAVHTLFLKMTAKLVTTHVFRTPYCPALQYKNCDGALSVHLRAIVTHSQSYNEDHFVLFFISELFGKIPEQSQRQILLFCAGELFYIIDKVDT